MEVTVEETVAGAKEEAGEKVREEAVEDVW